MQLKSESECFDAIEASKQMGFFNNSLEARNAFVNLLRANGLFNIDKYREYDKLFGLDFDDTEELESAEEELARIEFSNHQDSLYTYLEDGWTSEYSDFLLGNKAHLTFIKGMDYDKEVIIDLQKSGLQILGRLNNPKKWSEIDVSPIREWKLARGSFADNRKGLVYGMVQSGKTASMLFLTELALSAGYNFIIHLSSDKESLRDQTQTRINALFDVSWQESKSHNFITPTYQQDYIQAFSKQESVGVKYRALRHTSYVICIKKQKDNLNALLQDLIALKQNSKSLFKVDYEDLIKCLIIDDEADYASQNNKRKDISAINELLTKIRKSIVKNDYVGYTATPQACFGASKDAIVGYPSDFVYPISPLQQNNRHLSYCGHFEFFLGEDSSRVINLLEKDCWIHWSKDDTAPEIYIPQKESAKKDFKTHERQFLKELESKTTSSSTAKAFKTALKDYIVATSVRWYRHAEKYDIEPKNLAAKIREIKAINSPHTPGGFEEFPHTAMMFNAVLENEGQEKLKKIIKECVYEFLEEIRSLPEIKEYFIDQIKTQFEKSRNMDCAVPEINDLLPFIDASIEIILNDESTINNDIVYLLNSSDEGQNLKYDTHSSLRPKRGAIFIGGHMLGRGITIEGLITSVFLRSQNASMMDTNLQMCRWFGHKRSYFDLCSLYIQGHNLNLFTEISKADIASRKALRDELLEGKSGRDLLNVLYSSSLFRLTSPNKSNYSVIVSNNMHGGKSIALRGSKIGLDWKNRPSRLIEKLNALAKDVTVLKAHNRAFVLKDLNYSVLDTFLDLWPQDSIDRDKYLEIQMFLMESSKAGDLDKLNIAVYGASFSNEYNEFTLGGLNQSDGISETGKVNMPRRAFDNIKGSVKSLSGGSTKTYAGDRFIDIEDHSVLLKLKQRRKKDGALMVFYILNAQYLSKFEEDKLEPGQPGYSEEGMLAAVIHTVPSSVRQTVTINEGNLHCEN